MGNLAGAAGLVAVGAVAAWKALESGAELELARNRFDNLTASINTTSDAMLTDLKAATGGMMSDADMIASASRIISLGLADTQEGVVDLLRSCLNRLGHAAGRYDVCQQLKNEIGRPGAVGNRCRGTRQTA